MNMSTLAVSTTGAIMAGLWLILHTARKKSKLPYPPGPRGLPIIGNIFDINLDEPHLAYVQWNKIYGEIVYYSILGQKFVVVNSEKVARALAEQRSAIYSDRHYCTILTDFGVDRMTFIMGYRNEWKAHRRLLNNSLRRSVVDQYHDLHLRNARKLLENIQRDNMNYYECIDLYTGATALELTYGFIVDGKDDPVLSLANGMTEAITRGLTPGLVALLTTFPILRYLPSWFPGAAFKRDGRRCKELIDCMANIPFATAKKEMQRGLLPPCLASDVLKDEAAHGSAEKDALAGVFVAASETTAATLKMLALVMVLNQDVQDKVHKELDAVIGKGMLPTFEDKERLPYLQAVLYEVMRWYPVIPIGLAHCTTTSDVYEGYYIPKGCLVIFNVWSMKDHEYTNPEHFDPARHLTSDGKIKPESKQRNSIYFGFGKRICPGRYFAENAVWAAAAVMLSTLRFEKAKDSAGNEIYPDPIFIPGVIRWPVPFKCTITNRFKE